MILHSEIGRIDLVTLALPQFVKVPTAGIITALPS